MAVRSCYKGPEFAERIKRSLGVDVSSVSCHIVDDEGMKGAMAKSGWARNEMDGVVGFQVGSNIYVRDDSQWTTLHELVHRAGVNADRLNRFVAEGLTEVVASELRTSKDEHQPTYPEETRWIRQVLLPKLGMTALELGRAVANAEDPPRFLTDLLMKRDPKLDRTKLLDELRPQRPGVPTISSGWGAPQGSQARVGRKGRRTCPCDRGRCPHIATHRPELLGSLTRGASSSVSSGGAVGSVLLVLGAALVLPTVIDQWSGRKV